MSAPPEKGAATAAPNGETAIAPSLPGSLMHGDGHDEAGEGPQRDLRFDRMPMQLNVMVQVRSFRVQDLLALEKGTVVETIHEHTQDVPLECGGALLMWAEFELVGQRLAVRVTRLA
jgi:flagellar motor switch/type III secretory pathway protein FliN